MFYYCFSPSTQQEGYVPKNYTQPQKPLQVLPATVTTFYTTENEVVCFEGEVIILLARMNDSKAYFKKMNRDQQTGAIEIKLLEIEGEIGVLPTIQEYDRRKAGTSLNRSGACTPMIRSSSSPKLTTPQNLAREDKVIKRLLVKSKSRDSLGKSFLQLFSSQPQY